MNRMYRLLALVTIPFFISRTLDVFFNIDPHTGFYYNNGWFIPATVLFVLVTVLVLMRITVKNKSVIAGRPSSSAIVSAFLFVSSIATAAGSVFLLFNVFNGVGFTEIFMSRAELFDAGFASTHFRIEFWCSLAGLVAAVWFIFAVVCFLTNGGDLSAHPWFCCVPVLWFCIRALADYSIAPVNPNNTVIFASLASDLILALFFFRYCRFAALGYPAEETKKLAVPALLAFIFTVSFKLPLVVFAVETSMAETLYILSDAFAATAAFCIVNKILKGAVVVNEQEN
jgi:hypothetical protein